MSLLLMSFLLLAACSSKDSSGDEDENGVPKIYIYSNTGSLNDRPEGSSKDALEEIRQHIIDEAGVHPVAIVPPKGTATEKLNLLLGSSNDKVDVFQGSWDIYKDAIIPINDLLDKHGQAIKAAWPEEAWASVTDKDGNIWGVPRGGAGVTYPLWIRTDWLEKLDLEMPKTLDELEVVLEAFKQNDPDGNGENDTIPILTDLKSMRMAFVGGFTESGYGNWLDSDGKMKPAELAPGYKDFLAKMAEWYQKGYIYKESFSQYDQVEMFSTNRVGISAKWYSGISLNVPKIKQSIPEMEYEIVRGITGPKGFLQTANRGGSSGMLISKKAANPEAVMKFINWQYENVENHITMEFGAQGKAWEWSDDEKYYIKTLEDTSYAGEFQLSLGLPLETKYSFDDPLRSKHAQYLAEEINQLDMVKMPIDINTVYNQNILQEKVPNIGDIDRLIEEETIKFVMGARDLDEYDDFIDELYKAGLDKWIDAYTEIYNEQTK